MLPNKRRAKRKNAALPVHLALYNSEDDTLLSGPVAAYLFNISYYGAGLILKKVFVPPYHLFYTPRERKSAILCLEKNHPSREEIIIPLEPIWLRLDDDQAQGYFRMGVEFKTHPEDQDIIDLEEMTSTAPQGTGSLLARLKNIFFN